MINRKPLFFIETATGQFIQLIMIGTCALVLSTGVCGCTKAEKVSLGEHSAVIPVPQDGDWWAPLHQEDIERMKQGNVDLLFIGDSIMRHWESKESSCCSGGYEMWQKYYAPRNALNMGISADRTQNVLWRLDHVPLTNITPRLAIILIGTNNSDKATFGEDNTAEEISEGIIAICQKLRTDLRKTKILILAVFPRQEIDLSRKIAEASVLASDIADNEWVFYLDIAGKFLDKDGNVRRELMPDGLHPNAQGYQVWAENMEPMIVRLMNEQKTNN